ncbi:MAG: hypothetical protein R3B74_14815 [Nitrospirales bacterium]|nr:hypothetical protein [Nitrospirales bacterium]
MMRYRFSTVACLLIVLGMFAHTGEVWSSPGQAGLTVKDESIAGAPVSPTSPSGNRAWNFQKSPDWEKRFFDKPLSPYNFSKNPIRLPNVSGIPLKSPGKLPGIEFGVEMHSLEALQSVIPPDQLPKSLNAQQNQPLLLPPSNISPDYNGGFLRFTW